MIILEDELAHEGTKRHSGRYPWGSGENPYQHEGLLSTRIDALKKQGLTEKEIADSMGLSINQLRRQRSLEANARKAARDGEMIKLYDQGLSSSEIASKLGLPESTVRSRLKVLDQQKKNATQATIDVIRENTDKYSYIDIGSGVAESMGISNTRFRTAVQALENEGYTVQRHRVMQQTNPGQYTEILVLAKPGVTWQEVEKNKLDIGIINAKFESAQSSKLLGLPDTPKSISSDRIEVVYNDEGGGDKDGVIELRRNVDGLSLGASNYAQVRIAVDDTHYLKGMAVYADDLPKGIDIRFNTSKDPKESKLDAFKEMKTTKDPETGAESIDMDNPFGATIERQNKMADGTTGYLNIVTDAGDWRTWKKSLPSQMLSKQSLSLAKQQLDISSESKHAEFQEIMSLTNPEVKRHMLEQFASNCDADASHLAAAALPRQQSHVILPATSLKPNEVYAPGYKDGETVVLIRFPHAGQFEIPELRVNNRNAEAKKLISGASTDAICINPSVASRLSGADFDGDSVLVIPNNEKRIKTESQLKELSNFDPHREYAGYPGMKKLEGKNLQREMGVVSNLITDMTIRGASKSDIARAVRYSMVVIDAEKHELDWQRAKKEEGIDELQRMYQKHPEGTTKKGYGGASTLISKAGSEVKIPHRKAAYKYAPDGSIVYTETGKTYYKKQKDGTWVETPRYSTVTRMDLVKDARELSSGTRMEDVYARYANDMKALANQARQESMNTTYIRRLGKEERAPYEGEIASLKKKLIESKQHDPYERKAQVAAAKIVAEKRRNDPSRADDKDTVKRWRAQALAKTRANLGGKKPTISFTDREWEAVQAGAISKTMLRDLMKYANQDELKQRALPKSSKIMTSAKISRAKSLLSLGYTRNEVAEQLGVSVSTLDNAIYGK